MELRRMKMLKFTILIFVGWLAAVSLPPVKAQDAALEGAPQQNLQPPRPRPNLLRELNLTGEQLQQIRRLNVERRARMDEAQRRLRVAQRGLDQAIYADAFDDREIEARLGEVHAAQANVVRLRARTELEVRKVLTPEQLIRFRELRQRFAENREAFQNRRQNRLRNLQPDPPNRLFNRPRRRFPRN